MTLSGLVEKEDLGGREQRPLRSHKSFVMWVGVLVCACTAALFGGRYLDGNHASYLLHAFHWADPHLFTKDWVVLSGSYHPVFSALFQFLVGHSWSPTLFVMGAVTLNFLILWLFWILLWKAFPSVLSLMFLSAACVTFVYTETIAAQDTDLLVAVVQPSLLGWLGWLVALVAVCSGLRPILCGALAAPLLAFHLNFLVLFFPFFFGIVVFAKKPELQNTPDLRSRFLNGLKQLPLFVAPAIVAAVLLNQVLNAATGESAGIAREILQDLRAPHHYQVDFQGQLLFLTLQATAIACHIFTRLSRNRQLDLFSFVESSGCTRASWLRPLLIINWWSIAVMNVCTIFAWCGVRQIAQLFPWRILPLNELLLGFEILCFMALFLSYQRRAMVMLLPLLIPALLVPSARVLVSWASLVLFLVVAATWKNRRIRLGSPRTVVLAGSLSVFGFLFLAIPNAAAVRDRYQPSRPELQNFFSWVRQTEKDTLFVVPPDLGLFRIRSLRSIVVDFKSLPLIADGVVEWEKRIREISGVSTWATLSDLVHGYGSMGRERYCALLQRYSPNYVVFWSNPEFDWISESDVAYEDSVVTVYSAAGEEHLCRK